MSNFLKELLDSGRDSVILESYLSTILWCESDNSDEYGGELLENNYSIYNFSKDSILKANEDCDRFLELTSKILDEYEWRVDDVARDFWLTRNHHGSGFWDDTSYLKEDRDLLTEIVNKNFKECYVYINENEEIEIE